MSLSTPMFSTDVSQMMIEFVNQDVRIEEIFFARHVDCPVAVYVTA